MKKTIFGLILPVIFFTVCACNSRQNDSKEAEKELTDAEFRKGSTPEEILKKMVVLYNDLSSEPNIEDVNSLLEEENLKERKSKKAERIDDFFFVFGLNTALAPFSSMLVVSGDYKCHGGQIKSYSITKNEVTNNKARLMVDIINKYDNEYVIEFEKINDEWKITELLTKMEWEYSRK